MTKIMIVPDIHGRRFWKEPLDKYINDVDKVIFLGDYLDFYPDEFEIGEHTRKNDIDNFLEIIDVKRKYGDKVILLKGNHDQHYASNIFNHYAGGTRQDKINWQMVHEMFNEFSDLFQLAYAETIGDKMFLFTHAGVTNYWLDKAQLDWLGNTSDEPVKFTNFELADMINKMDNGSDDEDDIGQKLLSTIGRSRSWFGEKTGSPLWADVGEHQIPLSKKHGLTDIFQIFGHTRLNYNVADRYQTEFFACIDSQQVFILDNTELLNIKQYEEKQDTKEQQSCENSENDK